MKAYIFVLMLILLFIPTANAELTLDPELIDNDFLYSGLGENQTSEYEFISTYNVTSCEMIPQNESISCTIEEDYIIKIWFTTLGEPYIGKLQVTDINGTTTDATFIIRTHDFSSYSQIPEVPVGNLTNSTRVNIYFNTDDGNINGIRSWVIGWLFVLFGFAFLMSLRK